MVTNEALDLSDSQMSEKEIELVQELIKVRSEKNQPLNYEQLEGYELPPRSQFSMLKRPAVSIKMGKIRFNMAAIRLFKDIKHIIPVVNRKEKKLAIIPCEEEESASVEWARRRRTDNRWVNKDITSVDFTNNLMKLMGWDPDCRYKIMGYVSNSERGLILVFELEEATMFEPKRREVVDPNTGKKKIYDPKYYPNKYEGKIGRSYSDYKASLESAKFEDLGSYESISESSDTFSEELDVVEQDTEKQNNNLTGVQSQDLDSE